jgi:hypothetical protein
MRDRYSARAIDPICMSVDLQMEKFARHALNWRGEAASFGPIPRPYARPAPMWRHSFRAFQPCLLVPLRLTG